MGFGFALMVLGLFGYLGITFFSFTIEDIDEVRITTILGLLSMIAFMIGTIMEIRDLHHSREIQKEEMTPTRARKVPKKVHPRVRH